MIIRYASIELKCISILFLNSSSHLVAVLFKLFREFPIAYRIKPEFLIRA